LASVAVGNAYARYLNGIGSVGNTLSLKVRPLQVEVGQRLLCATLIHAVTGIRILNLEWAEVYSRTFKHDLLTVGQLQIVPKFLGDP